MCVREREREAEKRPRGSKGGYEYERLENRAGKSLRESCRVGKKVRRWRIQ